MDYKQLVKESGNALKASSIGKHPAITRFWERIQFRSVSKQELSVDAQLDVRGLPTISLYPSVLARPGNRAKDAVLSEFGLYVFDQGGEETKSMWENKLGLPEPGQVDAVDQKLKNPELRSKCHTYLEVVKTFNTAVDRLVALNVFNALLANNVAYPDSIGVEIKRWGATLEYCNRRRFHSLVPLTTAYASRELNDHFGKAFSSLVLNNLGLVREKSTQVALSAAIASIVDKIR